MLSLSVISYGDIHKVEPHQVLSPVWVINHEHRHHYLSEMFHAHVAPFQKGNWSLKTLRIQNDNNLTSLASLAFFFSCCGQTTVKRAAHIWYGPHSDKAILSSSWRGDLAFFVFCLLFCVGLQVFCSFKWFFSPHLPKEELGSGKVCEREIETLVWSGLPKTITDYHRLPLTQSYLRGWYIYIQGVFLTGTPLKS